MKLLIILINQKLELAHTLKKRKLNDNKMTIETYKANKLKVEDRCKNYSDYSEEPLLHSHIQDSLDDVHPLAWETVYCEICGCMLHDACNECMNSWFETEAGNFCCSCFNEKYPTIMRIKKTGNTQQFKRGEKFTVTEIKKLNANIVRHIDEKSGLYTYFNYGNRNCEYLEMEMQTLKDVCDKIDEIIDAVNSKNKQELEAGKPQLKEALIDETIQEIMNRFYDIIKKKEQQENEDNSSPLLPPNNDME